jgi:hypothetical protein
MGADTMPPRRWMARWIGASLLRGRGSILPQNPAQMDLAQDDDMVYTLAPDRSDQPFGKAVLPR